MTLLELVRSLEKNAKNVRTLAEKDADLQKFYNSLCDLLDKLNNRLKGEGNEINPSWKKFWKLFQRKMLPETVQRRISKLEEFFSA